MTESEWSSCNNPWAMAEFLEPRGSGRKLRLFAVACCRRARALSDDPRHLAAIDAAELAADGQISEARFEEVMRPVIALWAGVSEFERGPFRAMIGATRHLVSGRGAKWAARFAARGLADLQGEEGSPPWAAVFEAEEAAQCALLRDLFGDPFRPFRLDPAWLTAEGRPAVEAARRIDEEGGFGDLSALAAALEASGCPDRTLLDHCREPGPHVRGCWAVDALLGRESAVQSGLLTEADWLACDDPAALMHFLRDKGTERQWRRFAVACCRRIAPFITDPRSRSAVEVASRYADGTATEAELAEARAEAEAAQVAAKAIEYQTEAEEDFCLTPRYAAVSRDLFAARAARSAVCRDPRETDDDPETYPGKSWGPAHKWAVAVVHYHVYAVKKRGATTSDNGTNDSAFPMFFMAEHGKMGSGRPPEDVEEAADCAEQAERRAQGAILRDLFGDLLGLPCVEGQWLECGTAAPVSEWWCRLPTPRRVEIRPEWAGWSGGAIPKLAGEIRDCGSYDRLPALADLLEQAGCGEPTILGHLRGGGPHVRGCWILERLVDLTSGHAPVT